MLTTHWGYHPDPDDLVAVAAASGGRARVLILGSEVPDVRDAVDQMRRVANAEHDLPTGLYWFGEPDRLHLMSVPAGSPAASSALRPARKGGADDALDAAREWYDFLWEQGDDVARPRFALHQDVILRATGEDHAVRRRFYSGGAWLYTVRSGGSTRSISEDQLEPLEHHDDPASWVAGRADTADRLAATLTRAKLTGAFTDTVFSFRATKTIFRSYQFKPVIRMLESGKSRLLIADEVGLGKTIEAGLIWTELEARSAADRVLVVCPASLVAKWRREMEMRFGFSLTELRGTALSEFLERAQEGRVPPRFAHVISMERLRTLEDLDELVDLVGPLSLAIVDEAHVMRNGGTKSFAAGSLLGQWAEAMVLLTATPINLRNTDLFNLLDLLTPGEFSDEQTLELQLEPNVVLNRLAKQLTDPLVDGETRVRTLASLGGLLFGPPVLARPEAQLLQELVSGDVLLPRQLVEARRYLADLNALSAVLTRTRRVDVDEKKAVRVARDVQVEWTPSERRFYTEYVTWCRRRAEVADVPVGFAMQMPLRLASACLPAARDAVLGWSSAFEESTDEDADVTSARAAPAVAPHADLVRAARALGDEDTKRDLLLERLHDLVANGRRGIVFTFSRPALAYLASQIGQKLRVAVLHGGVDRDQRNVVMEDFRAGRYDVLLANRVASEGLDFEFCSAIVNYDLPWNPMEVEQRIGRIDRIGQLEERISILNMWCPAALDESIKLRLLQRIGVFEGTIGALEPIINEHLSEIRDSVFDFTLTAAEREAKADAALAAIEAQEQGLQDVASASPFLLATGDADIAGSEQDILDGGRYVGAAELTSLLRDWAHTAGAGQVQVSVDGRVVALRGNRDMAEQLRALTRTGRLTGAEVAPYLSALVSESELHVSVDHESARTSRRGDLLSARHPLVLAAASIPEQRHARYAHVRICRDDRTEPGTYVLLLARASWQSARSGHEIWGAAVGADGAAVGDAYTDLLLSALARGEIAQAECAGAADLPVLVARAEHALLARQVAEQRRLEHQASALRQSRRLVLSQQQKRRLAAIDTRLETSRQRGSQGVRLFEAQRRKAAETYAELVRELDSAGPTTLSLTSLAVAVLEVVDDDD